MRISYQPNMMPNCTEPNITIRTGSMRQLIYPIIIIRTGSMRQSMPRSRGWSDPRCPQSISLLSLFTADSPTGFINIWPKCVKADVQYLSPISNLIINSSRSKWVGETDCQSSLLLKSFHVSERVWSMTLATKILCLKTKWGRGAWRTRRTIQMLRTTFTQTSHWRTTPISWQDPPRSGLARLLAWSTTWIDQAFYRFNLEIDDMINVKCNWLRNFGKTLKEIWSSKVLLNLAL